MNKIPEPEAASSGNCMQSRSMHYHDKVHDQLRCSEKIRSYQTPCKHHESTSIRNAFYKATKMFYSQGFQDWYILVVHMSCHPWFYFLSTTHFCKIFSFHTNILNRPSHACTQTSYLPSHHNPTLHNKDNAIPDQTSWTSHSLLLDSNAM